MWWLLCIFLLPFLYFFYNELKLRRMRKFIEKVPGPKRMPWLGNALQVGRNGAEIFTSLFKFWKIYGNGGNFRVWNASRPIVYICDPKDVEFILTSNILVHKSPFYSMLNPWLGQGLITANGARWFKHRKMITPSFHFQILKNFHEFMNRNSTKFIEKLTEVSSGGNIFDMQQLAMYFTLDLICDTAMGVNINAMDNPDSELVAAYKLMCHSVNARAFVPWKRNNTLFKYTSEYPQYEKALKIIRNFTYEIIEKRIEARKQFEHDAPKLEADSEFVRSKMAFLDTLLTASIEGQTLTNQQIYEEVSTFIFAGFDTTSTAISFFIYLLSRHADVQQKVYEEQLAIVGASARNASYQEIQSMRYLDACMKECMRLYPSVPIVGRICDQDYNINGQIMPKGTVLNVFLMALGYNDAIFAEPQLFKPERFESEQPISPFTYVPFSAGPRNCIGQKFAILELKTVVSKIVRNFEILPALNELASHDRIVQDYLNQNLQPDNAHKYQPILSMVLTLKSDNGLHIRLRARKTNK